MICGVIIQNGGHVKFSGVVEILGFEVIETVVAAIKAGHPDLSDGAGFYRSVRKLQYTAFQFAALDRGLDDDFRVVPARFSDRRGKITGRGDPADPDGRTAARRFNEQREAKACNILGTGAGLPRAQHNVVTDGQPSRIDHLLGELLIHSGRTGEDPGTHVRHAGEFQQTLDGAVLAVGAVQNRKHHVHGGKYLGRQFQRSG